MTVRPASVGDEEALARLNAVVQQIHSDVVPEWFKPPDIEAVTTYFREVLRSHSFRVFIAEADGGIRGYALAQIHRQPETAFTYAGLVVELDQIVVDPEYRGRGLGGALIDHVKTLASQVGAKRLQLVVWNFNTKARQVFEHAGFVAAMTKMLSYGLDDGRSRSGEGQRRTSSDRGG